MRLVLVPGCYILSSLRNLQKMCILQNRTLKATFNAQRTLLLHACRCLTNTHKQEIRKSRYKVQLQNHMPQNMICFQPSKSYRIRRKSSSRCCLAEALPFILFTSIICQFICVVDAVGSYSHAIPYGEEECLLIRVPNDQPYIIR